MADRDTDLLAASSSAAIGAWAPLRTRLFRFLWLAGVVSNVGTFMHTVGAGWAITSLTDNPTQVSLLQTTWTAPGFLFACVGVCNEQFGLEFLAAARGRADTEMRETLVPQAGQTMSPVVSATVLNEWQVPTQRTFVQRRMTRCRPSCVQPWLNLRAQRAPRGTM